MATGWALDPDLPNGAIAVYFYVDGPMSFETYAGVAWARLPGTAGTPSANHAFSWRIPDRYRDGASHTLYAHAIDCSGLKRDSPLLGQRSFVLPPGNALPSGVLEKIDTMGKVKGWAVDPNTAPYKLTVSFYVSVSKGVLLAGQVVANLPNPAANQATGCAGDYGFQWSVPSQYRDNALHHLYAYAYDSSTQERVQLKGSPQTFTLTPTEDM